MPLGPPELRIACGRHSQTCNESHIQEGRVIEAIVHHQFKLAAWRRRRHFHIGTDSPVVGDNPQNAARLLLLFRRIGRIGLTRSPSAPAFQEWDQEPRSLALFYLGVFLPTMFRSTTS